MVFVIFELFYANIDIDELLEQMQEVFMTNPITIRPNKKSKPRLDKNKHKSTITTNSVNYCKRRKKVI